MLQEQQNHSDNKLSDGKIEFALGNIYEASGNYSAASSWYLYYCSLSPGDIQRWIASSTLRRPTSLINYEIGLKYTLRIKLHSKMFICS